MKQGKLKMANKRSVLEAKKRRKRQRIRKIRLFFRWIMLICLLAAVVTAAAIGTSKAIKAIKADIYGSDSAGASVNSSEGEEKLNLKTLSVPDYVDVQLITNTEARQGIKLKKIRNIVIHYTGNPKTTAQNNRDYFNSPGTVVCSHFVIGIDGKIIQCVPIDEKSAASNERNKDTISIEVCHSDESGKFSSEAYNSLVKLTAYLCDDAGLDENDIIRHYDITGKQCPLYYVKNPDKWNLFKKDVGKQLKAY